MSAARAKLARAEAASREHGCGRIDRIRPRFRHDDVRRDDVHCDDVHCGRFGSGGAIGCRRRTGRQP